jgi:hypothetical protein
MCNKLVSGALFLCIDMALQLVLVGYLTSVSNLLVGIYFLCIDKSVHLVLVGVFHHMCKQRLLLWLYFSALIGLSIWY